MILARREERARVRRALMMALASVATTRAVPAEPPPANDDGPRGLLVRAAPEAPWSAAPRLESAIAVQVTGLVARARVEQRFLNPSTTERVEARYLLPLPVGAAVDRMELAIGERRIVGEVHERAQARRIHAEAVASGRRSSLVEARRPDVYEVRVAGIDPGAELSVVVEYQTLVEVTRGRFALRLPLVVAPRYEPEEARDRPRGGVLPAQLARPGAVPDGPAPLTVVTSRSVRRPVSLDVVLRPGTELAEVTSPTHELAVERRGPGEWRVGLRGGTAPADRDLELVWRLAGDATPRLARFEEELDGQRYSALLFLPPEPERVEAPLARELVVVLDVSGSMKGASIRQAKRAVRLALSRLEPWARFNLIAFANRPRALFPGSVEAGPRALAAAEEFLDGLEADGGTEMRPALEAALDALPDAATVRQVLFVTDAQIGNEEELLALIEHRVAQSRLFVVGIGSAPNAWFVRRAAELGRGTHVRVGDLDEVEARMGELLGRLELPVLADLELEWDDWNVEAYPERPRDLYAGEPLLVVARHRSSAPAVSVRGRLGDAPFARYVGSVAPLPAAGLSKLWAARRIESLEDAMRRPGADAERLRGEIVATAIEHSLASRFTSFVAVERQPSAAPGSPVPTRDVATLPPAGGVDAALPQGATGFPVRLAVGLLLLAGGGLVTRFAA